MTKIESFNYSIELWNWLADNPGLSKSQHPTLPTKLWNASCAFCQYVSERTTKELRLQDCHLCPMYNKWPTSTSYQAECSKGSAYATWENFTYKWITDPSEPTLLNYDLSFFALILVEAFEIELSNIS